MGVFSIDDYIECSKYLEAFDKRQTANGAYVGYDKDMVDFVACFEISWASTR